MSEDREALRRELEAMSTSELVSVVRNRDEGEWPPEAFEEAAAILEARGVSAAEAAALGPEGFDVAEGQPLATLGRYFNPVVAHAHRLALEEAGVPAWVADETLGTSYGIGVGARLQVRAEDEARAREVLKADPVPASALPADLAEPPCPRCGSPEVSQRAEVVEEGAAAEGASPNRAWRYECAACGHTWRD